MFLLNKTQTKITFDASNAEHRKLFREFLLTRSWKHTDVRFQIEDNFVDVPSMITKKVLAYYMAGDAELKN